MSRARKTPPARMLVVDRRKGLVEIEITLSKDRSLIGKHHAAIARYLDTGEDDRLKALTGKSVSAKGEKYELETDPATIEAFALAGDLGYEDIYVLE